MKDLIALVDMLSSRKMRQIDIITESGEMTKTRVLYQAIRDKQVKNDLQAVQLIYGTNNPKDHRYLKLKHRLKERILNTSFFIDIQNYGIGQYDKYHTYVYKNYFAAKILARQGLSKPSLNIRESILKYCIKYDITEIAISILMDQKKRYGLFEYNKSKLNKYSTLLLEQQRTLDLKIIIEDCYTFLAYKLVGSKGASFNKEIQALESKLNNHQKEVETIDSFFLRFHFYNAKYFSSLIKKNLDEQMVTCQKALNYFETKKSFGNIGIYSFTQKIALVYLAKKKYDDAIVKLIKSKNLVSEAKGYITWQYPSNYLFTAYILTSQYDKAYQTISSVVNDKRFKDIPKDYLESWYIKEAFIHFLIKFGKIDPTLIKAKKLRNFRLGRFLNETPSFTKDKRGLNITINIVKVLFQLLEEKYDKVEDNLNILKVYSHRYLRAKEYQRPRSFIALLHKIPTGNYKRSAIQLKSKIAFEKLKESPMDFSEQSLQIEIIPYEQLWDLILEMF